MMTLTQREVDQLADLLKDTRARLAAKRAAVRLSTRVVTSTKGVLQVAPLWAEEIEAELVREEIAEEPAHGS